ncbi:MAG: hypothetical protein AB7U43_13500 [Desulfobacter sp.]
MSYPIKSQAVLGLAGWAPTGDLIDHSWFQHIRRKDKPYYQAILLLGRIAYMYRPVDVLDPRSQLVIGRAQKFEADLWQQSRRSLASYFGMSLNDVDAALEALKRIGVIWTELRTIVVKGQRMSNTLYIGLNTSKLMEISTPMVLQTDSYPSGEGELSVASTKAMALQQETNTEITRKKTRKSRSTTPAAASTSNSAEKIESQAIQKAIIALPPVLQRDASQIALEEAWAGEEVIVSNFLLLTARKDLTGGLLRSAVRNDYAASHREKLREQEAARKKKMDEREALENRRQANDEALSQGAQEWCASEEGKQFWRLIEQPPKQMLSEGDRELRERIQRDRLNQQRQELLNAGLMDATGKYSMCSQMDTNTITSSQQAR